MDVTKRRKPIYHTIFNTFKVRLDVLVDIAVKIQPDCLLVRKNCRQRDKVIPRQMLCYIAGSMGYIEEDIARAIHKDRTTVNWSKTTVLNELMHNNVDYHRVFRQFIDHLKLQPGGDILRDVE